MKTLALISSTVVIWFGMFHAGRTQISFEDITQQSGLGGLNELGYGTAFLDFDNDGLQDIFVVGQNGLNRLFRNLGTLEFTDLSSDLEIGGSGAGWGVCYGDFDSDYDEDIYISRRDYVKNDFFVFSNGIYREQADQLQVDDPGGFGYSSCFSPLTKNLSLDLVVTNQAWPNGLRQSCRFFAGNVGQPFTDITDLVGLADSSQYWDCVSAIDYDNDYDLDILVSGEPTNVLYRNNGFGSFHNVSDSARINVPIDGDTTGYGISWGDFNNDGWFDAYLTYWHDQYGELFINNGDGTFSDITDDVELGQEVWSHSVSFGDFDNDGWLDLYSVSGGYGNRLYRNIGGMNFVEIGDEAGVRDYHWCCGLSLGDIDRDGKLDMVIGHYADGGDEPNKVTLYHNITVNDNNWVIMKVNGFPPNPDAIGARVKIWAAGIAQMREVSGGSGFGSQNMLPVHFGIGSATMIDSAVISFPNAQIPPLVYYNLEPNRYHSLPEITPDISAVQILSPIETADCETPVQIRASIANVGNVDAANFKVVCELSIDTCIIPVDSTVLAFLAEGDTMILDFQPFSLPECGMVYQALCITRMIGDINHQNDTASTDFYSGYRHDVCCDNVISPHPESLLTPIIPIVDIFNPGLSSEVDFLVSCQITNRDSMAYSEEVLCGDTITILSHKSISFSEFTPIEGESYHFVFSSHLPTDLNSSNDSIAISITMPHSFCQYLLGDMNYNQHTNGVDLIFGVRCLRGLELPAYLCMCPPHGAIYAPADVNGTCSFNWMDITSLVNYFKRGDSLQWCLDCPPTGP